MTRRLFVAAVVLAAALPAARAERAPVFALVGGRVVTVSGAVHEGGTVILRDGLVEAVGTGLAVPPDARVVDAKGLVITPGLIDAFGGIGLPGAPPRSGGPAAAPAAGGETGLRPEALALDALRAPEALKARDSGVTTALVIPRDGVLPGRSVLVNLSGESAPGMVLRQPAALHLNMATLARRYPGSLMGTVALARQALLDAARYRDEWAAYERAPRGRKRPRFDAGLQAWTDVLGGRTPLVVGTRTENDVRRALALADEFKVRVVVAGGRQAARALPLLQARRPPLLLSVNFDPPAPASFFGSPDEDKTRREIDEAEREPARLHEAGVAFALVSGHASDLLAGARKAVERGLPREAALRALTLAPAEALGVADRLGSLEPGKIANVVAWTAEPLTAEARARMVFVDGELYEPEEKPKGRGGRGAEAADAAPAAAASPAPSPSPAASPSPQAVRAAEVVPPEPKPLPRTFALTGATILTASAQGTIPHGTILVTDGKIVSVSAGAAPSGVPVINAEGQFVTPGLIDAHSHIAIEGNVNECTDAITAEVRVTDVIDHRDPDIYRNLAGGVTTVNVLHGSCNAIGGQNAVLKLRRGRPPAELVFAAAPRGIKFALGENPKRSNFSVPGQRRYPATRMGVEALLRRSFQDALAYRHEWQEYQRKSRTAGPDKPPVAPRRDLKLETLVDVLEGRVLVHAHCYRADEILMLIKVAEEFGFRIKSFQHVLEGYKVASEIARHGAGASTFSDWWAYKMEAWDAIPYNAAIMASHGVVVSLNSDSAELARRLYWEAAKAVKYGGVGEDEALKMVTLNPAIQLGIEKHVGSIEPGKDADLTVFSAHPFSPDARVEMTIIEGVTYFDRERDLAARPAAAAAAGDAQ